MTYINTDIFISTTELKNNTKSVIEKTNNLGEIFIMNNNKPKVVMMSVEQYNIFSKYNIAEVEPNENEKKAIEKYEVEKSNWNLDLINEKEVFSILNELK